jgi:outer membrane biosynthesis protein TonB
VSDPASTARTARESLAKGLSALQSDPNVPPQILDLAAPIAQAMGALHAIERSNGTQLVPHAEVALNHTRSALSQLQNQPPTSLAVTQAMEAVAASLSSVHALSRMAMPLAPTAPQPAQPMQQQASAPRQPTPAPHQPPPPQAQPVFQPQKPVAAPQAQAPFPLPQQQPAAAQPAGYARDPFAAAPARGPANAAGSSLHPPSPPAAGTSHVVTADLGTQSPTNFYKGLSGNDIIDHGGIFVSTYMIPPIGTSVRLKISLPGGYEFEANGVVKWSREQSDDHAAPPGFGAQFTQITPEARQLVYRYTRNREPLFHDDL